MAKEFYLLDLERTLGFNKPYFWKWNRHGYTQDIDQAGLFSEPTANRICENDRDKTTVKISKSKVYKILGKGSESHEGTSYY